jgi:hypothetical protein
MIVLQFQVYMFFGQLDERDCHWITNGNSCPWVDNYNRCLCIRHLNWNQRFLLLCLLVLFVALMFTWFWLLRLWLLAFDLWLLPRYGVHRAPIVLVDDKMGGDQWKDKLGFRYVGWFVGRSGLIQTHRPPLFSFLVFLFLLYGCIVPHRKPLGLPRL